MKCITAVTPTSYRTPPNVIRSDTVQGRKRTSGISRRSRFKRPSKIRGSVRPPQTPSVPYRDYHPLRGVLGSRHYPWLPPPCIYRHVVLPACPRPASTFSTTCLRSQRRSQATPRHTCSQVHTYIFTCMAHPFAGTCSSGSSSSQYLYRLKYPCGQPHCGQPLGLSRDCCCLSFTLNYYYYYSYKAKAAQRSL